MQPPTRVFAIADSIDAARTLAEVFSQSAAFRVAGFAIASRSEELNCEKIDVFVIRSKYVALAALPQAVPRLWLGYAPGDNRRSAASGTHAWLADTATPEQIRAAALALAAGLRLQPIPGQNPAHPNGRDFSLVEPLTDRELEVLNLLAEGMSNPKIASLLRVSPNTVKFHVSSIMGKLAVNSRTEAVTVGLRHGLIII
jgi:DNA-binding NarL/FixJ family response regulator